MKLDETDVWSQKGALVSNRRKDSDELEKAVKQHSNVISEIPSGSEDLTKRKNNYTAAIPAPIWPKYVAKGHVYNAIKKLNQIRPSTPIPISMDAGANCDNNSNGISTIKDTASTNVEQRTIISNDLMSGQSKGHEKMPDIKEEPIPNPCIVKNGMYVRNIQIMAVDTIFAPYKRNKTTNVVYDDVKETDFQTVPPITTSTLRTDPSTNVFDLRRRNMSPIKEQANEEDINSSVHVQMSAPQNDSIVNDALLQLTSFSVHSSNGVDVLYDGRLNTDLQDDDEIYNPYSNKISTCTQDGEEDDKKKEDMDKVIQELTKAVMKSKNVTTLTRAMNQRKALNIESPYLNQKVIGNKSQLTGKESTSSSGTTDSYTSTEDGISDDAKRRSRRFKRNSNRIRNSVRTIQSLSKGSKGIDLMKSLWQQTGMITNGRKLLIDSLSEDETSNPGDEAKEETAIVSVNNNNCNGIENHQGVRAIDEVRYSVAPSHVIPLEKELLKRISSGGSTTTNTYAEVYTNSQASSTSPISSIGFSQSRNIEKSSTTKNAIQTDAKKNHARNIELGVDEIRVDEQIESLSSGSSVLGVPNRKTNRKVQFSRDIPNHEEIFTIENLDDLRFHDHKNKNTRMPYRFMTENEKSKLQNNKSGHNTWFITHNRKLEELRSDLEAYKELQGKGSPSESGSTSVSPIYNTSNDNTSSSGYNSVFSSPYFDYRKTHSKVCCV